ncbi:MAG: hypothetical protein K2L42_06200 [Clostridia bacterium]|nr:hypothetical protein [Clostridia bacterium]
MHKAINLVFVTVCTLAIVAALCVLPQRLCFTDGADYKFYCGTSSKDCKTVDVSGNAAVERLCLKNVCGESAVYENLDLESFLKRFDGEIVFIEELSDSVNYYCKANLPYSVNLYGKEINLHICVRGGTARAASPIIFGGY